MAFPPTVSLSFLCMAAAHGSQAVRTENSGAAIEEKLANQLQFVDVKFTNWDTCIKHLTHH